VHIFSRMHGAVIMVVLKADGAAFSPERAQRSKLPSDRVADRDGVARKPCLGLRGHRLRRRAVLPRSRLRHTARRTNRDCCMQYGTKAAERPSCRAAHLFAPPNFQPAPLRAPPSPFVAAVRSRAAAATAASTAAKTRPSLPFLRRSGFSLRRIHAAARSATALTLDLDVPFIHCDSCGPDVPISRAASACVILSDRISALHRAARSAGCGSICALPGAAFAVGTPADAGIGALIGWSFDELRGNLHGK
jgi:hypothetical protein